MELVRLSQGLNKLAHMKLIKQTWLSKRKWGDDYIKSMGLA